MGLFLWLILLVVVVAFDLLACVGFGFYGWIMFAVCLFPFAFWF